MPEEYLEVEATFAPAARRGGRRRLGGRLPRARGSAASGRLPRPGGCRRTGPRPGPIVERVRGGRAEVESVESETRRLPPPLLYDLTELQRHANRLHGLSAKETLAVAQALYEEKKLLTYPRTDSRHLSRDVAAGLPAVVAAIAGPYSAPPRPRDRREAARPALRGRREGDRPPRHRSDRDLGRRPRPEPRRAPHLRPRVPPAAHGVARRARLRGHLRRHAGGERPARPAVDRFASSGTAVQQAGWKVLEPPPSRPARPATRRRRAGRRRRSGVATSRRASPPASRSASPSVEAVAKKTRPPRRFTDATLLTAMETGRGAPSTTASCPRP